MRGQKRKIHRHFISHSIPSLYIHNAMLWTWTYESNFQTSVHLSWMKGFAASRQVLASPSLWFMRSMQLQAKKSCPSFLQSSQSWCCGEPETQSLWMTSGPNLRTRWRSRWKLQVNSSQKGLPTVVLATKSFWLLDIRLLVLLILVFWSEFAVPWTFKIIKASVGGTYTVLGIELYVVSFFDSTAHSQELCADEVMHDILSFLQRHVLKQLQRSRLWAKFFRYFHRSPSFTLCPLEEARRLQFSNLVGQ